MKIYPAIDLRGGQCVRLRQGDYNQETRYGEDPLAKITAYQSADCIHIVDLDGARAGKIHQLKLIYAMAKQSKIPLQVGGGIRYRSQIQMLLDNGIARVVIGSLAVTDPGLVYKWLEEFGPDKIVLALDIRLSEFQEPLLATQGWQTNHEKSLWQLLDFFQSTCLTHVLCTDISRDGMMQGANIALYRQCYLRYPWLEFQASGGINSLQDLRLLREEGVASVIIGRALYEGKFTLTEAILGETT